MRKTRVDVQRLLEDLRDAYAGSLEETILTEITANALDSGATRVSVLPNAADATLTVAADGRGMKRRDLKRCHDVAASSKARGQGIGFAGTGIKLGLLVADEVITETRRGTVPVATTWKLATRHRAPWKWIPPPGLTAGRGTVVRLRLSNPLSPLLDAGYLEEALRTHFAPLLDPVFDDLLRRHYPEGIGIDVEGRPLAPSKPLLNDRVTIPIRMGRKRLPSAIAVVQRHDHPLPEDQQGIAISTFGKVIKRGWDWLGLSPASAWRVTGLVEAPDLAACLTPSKNDFIRSGTRGATYLAYRKAIQEVVSRQLTAWGDSSEAEGRPKSMRLARELERVLEELSGDFPQLRSIVDRCPAGHPPGRGDGRTAGPLFANVGPEEDATALPAGAAAAEEVATPRRTIGRAAGLRRPARHRLLVQLELRPGDPELGRLVDSTIWINESHPAYQRAAASRSSGYHVALTVALALAPLAADAPRERAFITQFLEHWGRTSSARRRPKRRARTAL